MKIGISTACLYLRQETEDAITTIQSLGAEVAEVFLGTFYEYRPEFAKKYAPRAEGLEVNSVHTLSNNFEPMLFNRSRRVRGDGFYWLDQIMRSAQLFGCKNYTFHGKVGKAENINEIEGYLRPAVEFCARYGVNLCLENVAWSIYSKPGIFTVLKGRIPTLSGVFDIKQAQRSGYPYKEFIDDMKGSISHVHLSDMDKDGKMCLPGKGVYNFKEVLTRLKDAGFDGNIIIEVYKDDYNDIQEFRQALEFLNEIIYKIS